MRRLVDFSLRHPRGAALFALGLALLAAPGLGRLESDNSPRVYFPRSESELSVYERFVETFGGDSVLRLVWRSGAEPSPDDLARWDSLEREIGNLPGVRAVIGPATWRAAVGGDSIGSAAGALDGILGWRLPEGRGRSALVALDEASPEAERAALDAIEAAIEAAVEASPLRPLELVGFPVMVRAFDDSAREVPRRSFPLLVVIATALLLWIFRDMGSVFVPLVFVAWCEVLVLGAMGWAGASLNMIVAVLPTLVFVLALATAIHLVTRERELRRAKDPIPVGSAFRDKGRAVLWTTATAAVGFGSLATSEVGPVRSVGLWAAAACGLIAFACFALLPALLVLTERARRPGQGRIEEAIHRIGCAIAEASIRRIGWILGATLLLAGLAALGTTRLETESNALRYLRPSHPVRAVFERLESDGVGVAAVEVVLRATAPRFVGGEGMNLLSWIALRLREETAELGGLGALGAGDLVDDALRSDASGRMAPGGAGPRAAALARLRATAEGRDALRSLVTDDGRAARLTIFLPMGGPDELAAVEARAAAIVAEECPECSVEFTGQYSLLLATQGRLLSTLGRSFLVAVFGIGAILWLLLRRFRLTLLAMIPNVLPGLLVFGAMGWLGLPIDVATVMVAASTLGLALDDTIHTLVPFREQVRESPTFEAVLATVEKNATAYSVSGLVLGLGFLACAVSEFLPIQRFGLLSAAAIAIAVAADFLLVPALLGGAPRSVLVKTPSKPL